MMYLKPLNGCTKLLVDFENQNDGCFGEFDLVTGSFADGTFAIQKTTGGACNENAKLNPNIWFRCIETTVETSSTDIHMSCSEALPLCSVFGNYQVVGYENEDGTVGFQGSCPAVMTSTTTTTTATTCIADGLSCQPAGSICCPGLVCNDESPDTCRPATTTLP